MNVNNKYTFTIPTDNKTIDLPLEIKWDFYGRDDSIDEYETEVIKEVIGSAEDFEILRFAHDSYQNDTKTDVNYDFYFYNGNVNDVDTSTTSNWEISYLPEGFSSTEVYYYEKPFTKSFFKLDFYDTNDTTTQTNYFTIIIPVQQGKTENVSISSYLSNVNIKKPSFSLDYVGDKEGFFIYWLRKKTFINLDTFYMTAKFFDARLGLFVKMMNAPQSSIVGNKYLFDGSRYFYTKVVLDYNNKSYKFFDYIGNRVGDTNPIKWYEYINP
jgi:hypothetical protein